MFHLFNLIDKFIFFSKNLGQNRPAGFEKPGPVRRFIRFWMVYPGFNGFFDRFNGLAVFMSGPDRTELRFPV
jgi:hypothetical protein